MICPSLVWSEAPAHARIGVSMYVVSAGPALVWASGTTCADAGTQSASAPTKEKARDVVARLSARTLFASRRIAVFSAAFILISFVSPELLAGAGFRQRQGNNSSQNTELNSAVTQKSGKRERIASSWYEEIP